MLPYLENVCPLGLTKNAGSQKKKASEAYLPLKMGFLVTYLF